MARALHLISLAAFAATGIVFDLRIVYFLVENFSRDKEITPMTIRGQDRPFRFGRLLAAALALLAGALPAWAGSDAVTLKIGLLPIVDALPFYVAEARGFFGAGPERIVAVPVGSALERDQLLQAGEIDGVINEIVGVASFNRDKVQMRIIGMARAAEKGHPLFRVLAAPGSGLKLPADLSGVPIGVSLNTIIEYVTDRMLTGGGLKSEAIRKQSVPVIPERYQLLLQGQLRAATLPDPLGFSALSAGAVAITDDAALPRCSLSVLSFRSTALERKADAVRRFMAGWDQAVIAINADREAQREVLLRHIRVPPNVSATYPVPPFPRARVPDREQWQDVMEWMKGRGLLERLLAYEDSVTGTFLPASSERP